MTEAQKFADYLIPLERNLGRKMTEAEKFTAYLRTVPTDVDFSVYCWHHVEYEVDSDVFGRHVCLFSDGSAWISDEKDSSSAVLPEGTGLRAFNLLEIQQIKRPKSRSLDEYVFFYTDTHLGLSESEEKP